MERGYYALAHDMTLALDDLSSPPVERAPVTLSGYMLWLARALVVIVALLCIAVNVLATVDVWNNSVDLSHISAAPGSVAPPDQIRAALHDLGLSPTGFAIFNVTTAVAVIISFYGVGAYLLRHKSHELAVLLVVVFLFTMASATAPPDLAVLQSSHPIRATIALTIDGIWLMTFAALFFRFPDGRFTPRWTSGVVVGYGLYLLSAAWPNSFISSLNSTVVDAVVYVALLLSAVYAQLHRYRRNTTPIERQQTKWFLGGFGIALITFAVLNATLVDQGSFQDGTSLKRALVTQMLFAILWVPAQLCIPISLGVSIMRYRLFDINVAINRTLVYGGLTATIIGLYTLIVIGFGNLLNTGNNLVLSLAATVIVAILVQPLQRRMQRGVNRLLYGERDEPYVVLARLGRRLESTLAPDAVLTTVVDTVVDALKLPYVAIALAGSAGDEVIAARGEPVGGTVHINLTNGGERVGTLLVAPRAVNDHLTRADVRLLEDVARHAGPAVQSVRLSTNLQLARERLVLAREEERRRLRRDLHDGLGPRLASLILRLEIARDRLNHDPVADHLLAELSQKTEEAVSDIRRLVHNLRPPALDEMGLVAALRQAIDGAGMCGTEFVFEVPEEMPGLPAAVEVAAFRITQEATTNVLRHAKARRCTIRIALERAGRTLSIDVEDDGQGIQGVNPNGIGLHSMRERAEELGGTFDITVGNHGGTHVHVVLPLVRSASERSSLRGG